MAARVPRGRAAAAARVPPAILVSQHGCDTHWLDPLARLGLTIDAQRAAGAAIHELAHQLADGRWLLTGGGGYEVLQVVPRTRATCSPRPPAIHRPRTAHPARLA